MSKKSPKNLSDSEISSDELDEDNDYSRVKKYQFEKCNSSPFLQASIHSWSMIQTDGDEEEAVEEDVHEDYPVINSIDNIFDNFIYRPTSMKVRKGKDSQVANFLNRDYTFFSTQPITFATTNIPEQINSSVEKVLIHLLDLSLIPRSKKSTFIHSWYDLSKLTSVEATRMINQFIETNYKHIDKKSWEFRTEIIWASMYLSQFNKYQRTQQQTLSHSIRIFHYIGIGFPPPERNRIWMRDTNIATGSSSLQELSQTFYPPCLLIFDCDKAAILKDYLSDSLVRIINRLDHNGFSFDSNISKLFFSFFACSENEQLRIASNLPQNFFTCALLTPNKAFSAITGITVTDSSMFENLLNIFTDTIALETLTTDLFYRLFRGDSIVSNLWRRFLLAQRLMKSFGLHSQSIPDLPDMSEHQLWGQFEFSLMSVGIFNPITQLSDLYLKHFETTECPPDYVCAFVSSLLQLSDMKEIVMNKIASFMEKSPKNCRLIASFINFKSIGDFQTYVNSKNELFCNHCTIMSGLLLVASSILKVVNASFSMSEAIRICFNKRHFNDKIRVYILSILVALRDVQSRLSCFFNTENTTDKFLPLLFQSSPLLREWILLFIHSTISRFSLEIKIGSSYLHVYCMLLLAERRKLTRAAAVNILTTILIPRCFEFNRTIMNCALKAAVDGSRIVRFAFLCMVARFTFLNQDKLDGKITEVTISNSNNNSYSNSNDNDNEDNSKGFYHCADVEVNLNSGDGLMKRSSVRNLNIPSDDDYDDYNDYEGNDDFGKMSISSNLNEISASNNSFEISISDDFSNLEWMNKEFNLIRVENDDKTSFCYKVDAPLDDLGIDSNLDYIIRDDPITFAKMNHKEVTETKSSKKDENLNDNHNDKDDKKQVGNAPNLSLLLRRLVKLLCKDPYEHIRKFAMQLLKNPTKSGLQESFLRNSIEVHKMAHLLLFSASLDKSEMQQRYTDTFLSNDELELFEAFNANVQTSSQDSHPTFSSSNLDRAQNCNDFNSIMEPQEESINSLYIPNRTTSHSNLESLLNSQTNESQISATTSIENDIKEVKDEEKSKEKEENQANEQEKSNENTPSFVSSAVVDICFDLEHNNVIAATANGCVVWGENRWQISVIENCENSAVHSVVSLPKLSLAVASSSGFIYILRNGFYDPIDCFQPSTIKPSGKTVMTAVTFDAKPISKSEMKEKSIKYNKSMCYGSPKTTLLYISQGNNEILVWDVEALILIKRIVVPSPPMMIRSIKTTRQIERKAKKEIKKTNPFDKSFPLNNQDEKETNLDHKSPFYAYNDHDFQLFTDYENSSESSDEYEEEELSLTENVYFIYASLKNGSIIKISTETNEIIQVNDMYKDSSFAVDKLNFVRIGVHNNLLFSVSKNGPLFLWEDFDHPKQIIEKWENQPIIDFLVHPLFPLAIRIDENSIKLIKLYENSPFDLQNPHCISISSSDASAPSNEQNKKLIGTCCCFDGSRPLCAIGYDDGTVAVWRLKVH